MKNLTLTLTISSLILSILFFAYLAKNASTVGSTDRAQFLQTTDSIQRVTTQQILPTQLRATTVRLSRYVF